MFYGRKVCYCGKKASFNAAHKEKAVPQLQAKEMWICDRCGGILSAVQELVPVVRGPVKARALLHAEGHANGQSLLTWQVDAGKVDTVEYRTYHRRFYVHPEPLIFQSWQLLMSKVDVILAEPAGPGDNAIQAEDRKRAQSEARGIAEVLALLMKPFMESPDHVVKCAVAKYHNPDTEVPGLGEHLWDPTRNPDGSLRIKVGQSVTKSKPAARPRVDKTSTKTLTVVEAAGIKEAVASGLFGKEEIASMFHVSLETVEEAVRS